MTNALPQTTETPHSELLAAPKPGEGGLPTPHLEVLPAHKPEKRIRNGKIARLPFLKRDLVNRMLRDHVPYAKIVGALGEHDVYVTERNISNWKTRGGYKAWCAEQDRAIETRLLQDNLAEHLRKTDAGQLPEVGLQLAATHLSNYFLKPETHQQLNADPSKCGPAIAHLCRLARHIQAFQKYRDDSAKELGYKSNPERVRRDAEKDFEITREVYSAAKLGNSAREENIPRRNFIPKELSPELPPPLD